MNMQREIIRDWTRVADFEVAERSFRTYEYHVVADPAAERTIMTIKIFNEEEQTVRLDPSNVERDQSPDTYERIAERRVRRLYANGLI
jgi:hypothetical protein